MAQMKPTRSRAMAMTILCASAFSPRAGGSDRTAELALSRQCPALPLTRARPAFAGSVRPAPDSGTTRPPPQACDGMLVSTLVMRPCRRFVPELCSEESAQGRPSVALDAGNARWDPISATSVRSAMSWMPRSACRAFDHRIETPLHYESCRAPRCVRAAHSSSARPDVTPWKASGLGASGSLSD